MNDNSGDNVVKTLQITITASGIALECTADGECVRKSFHPAVGDEAQSQLLGELIEHGQIDPQLFSRTEVTILTDRLVLVPDELTEIGFENNYLSTNNMLDHSREIALAIPGEGGIWTAIAAPKLMIGRLREAFGERLEFRSPLEGMLKGDDETIAVRLAGQFGYVAMRSHRLEYAGAFPLIGAADVLWQLENLCKAHPAARKYAVSISGSATAPVVKLISRYFRKVEAK